MTADLFQKYLGIAEGAGPPELLGLGSDQLDAASVEAALRNRIARTYAHAEGRSDEAEQVRARLREAARIVLAMAKPPRSARRRRPGPGRAPRSVARLTDFDRMVLAVLIGCGGWNAATRSRLVALAAGYGVGVGGLCKVIAGLSEYAKSGGARLGLAEITAGGARVDALPPAPSERAESDLEWLAKGAPQLMESSARSTFKLSLLFGSVTLLVAVVAVRLLFAPAASRPVAEVEPEAPVAAIERATTAPPRRQAPTVPSGQRMVKFGAKPTFTGHALTAETVAAADECPRLVGVIDDVARRITVEEEPSEAVFRNWADCIRTIATGWVLVGDSVQESLDQAIFDALYAASDSPSVSDRLLEALTPPPWRILEPVDVWRGAWMSGTLARISKSNSLSPAVVDRARAQLDVALGGPSPDRTSSFEDAAGAWLDYAAVLLVDAVELDSRIYDLWEFWITAQRRLGRGDRFEQAMLTAVESFLTSSLDLARPGPAVNVLGRLLSLVDFESSRLVKDRIGELLADQDRFSPRDLWVLTSLMAQSDAAPWFGEDLVLPEGADWMFRRRLADRISQRWPEAATAEPVPEARVRGIAVDPELAARWLAAFRRQQGGEPVGTDELRLEQLIAACRLNEAAAWLAAGNGDRAATLLDALLSGAGGEPTTAAPRRLRRTGEPIGADGEWAVRYEQAGRGADERREWLEALRASDDTDLGPIDAEVFVRVAYRGSPPEVRMLAQSILVEQFGDGPNVALEMVDQLPGVPAGQAVSKTIGRLTGRLLPSSHSDSWPVDARLALVEHALGLLGPASSALDERLRVVIESYGNRRSALDPDWSPATGIATVRDAAEGLADAWQQRSAAASGEAVEPGPERGLVDLQRRHATRLQLVAGPIQAFIAAQLAVLDLMTYAAVAEQPALAGAAAAILAESGRRRSRCAHALEQAIEAERAMGRVWRLQIAVGTTEVDES